MLITVETTEPLHDEQVIDLRARLNDSVAYADVEVVFHHDQLLLLSSTDSLNDRQDSPEDDIEPVQAPMRSQLLMARSQAFYTAASAALAPRSAQLRQVHIETLDEHILLADRPEDVLD